MTGWKAEGDTQHWPRPVVWIAEQALPVTLEGSRKIASWWRNPTGGMDLLAAFHTGGGRRLQCIRKPRKLHGMMQKSHYWLQVHRAKNDGLVLVDIPSNNTRMLLLWQAKVGLLQEKMLIKGIYSMDLPRHLGRNRHPYN